jgi:hypothetical protein
MCPRESEIGGARLRRADFDMMTEFSEFNAKAQSLEDAKIIYAKTIFLIFYPAPLLLRAFALKSFGSTESRPTLNLVS